jgi:hypothetical protein
MQAACQKYPLLLCVTVLTQCGGEQKLLKLLVTQFYPVSRYFFPLEYNLSPQGPNLNYPQFIPFQ